MRIVEMYKNPEPTISFEFFPPKTVEDENKLFAETVPALKKLGPSFISVTYGAGGGTRDTTLRVVARVRSEHNIEAMSHLTCSNSTQKMIRAYLDEAKELGIENILALRGDPPKGQKEFQQVEGGFAYAVDLIRLIKKDYSFGIGAACYPEGHMECGDKKLDWDRAVEKVEAGAEFLITQLFYDWNDFADFYDYLRNTKNVKVPIVPGVLPFLSAKQIKRFTSLCGSKLPPSLVKQLEKYADDDVAVRQLGVDVCTDICQKALDFGVAGFHFYCLNRVPSCKAILENLESRPTNCVA